MHGDGANSRNPDDEPGAAVRLSGNRSSILRPRYSLEHNGSLSFALFREFHMKARFSRYGLLVAIFLCTFWQCPVVVAGPTESTTYVIPDAGILTLEVPLSWSDSKSQIPDEMPRTIYFSPTQGEAFEVLMTFRWNARQDPSVKEAQFLRSIAARAAEMAAAQATEKSLPIQRMPIKSGEMFFFSATDKAPRPGEYKFMTQGSMLIGDIAGTFTILTNDTNTSVAIDAMNVIRTAVFAADQ